MEKLYHDVQRSRQLEGIIRGEIRSGGPMTFARFMELALYHDPLGYYSASSDVTTRSGDFLTAPETHPAFGRLLARWAASVARTLGDPDFTVVEQGAGTGALAESFIDGWRNEAADTPMRYQIVEPLTGPRERLMTRLGGQADIVRDISDAVPFTGVFLSNELPDAFPVRRVRNRSGSLVEVYVGLDGDRLIELERPPSTPALESWLDDAGVVLAEGAETEVSLQTRPWLKSVAARLQRGAVLTIDYGYEAAEADRFPRGTLLAHYRHATNEDFLERIGRQDLTSHVCWTALDRYGELAGLRTVERTTQREFLTRWGWKELGREMLERGAGPAELGAFDRLGRLEDGLGHFGVLIQATPAD